MNCKPKGICEKASTDPQRPKEGPGSAGPLRGRKRDIFEGGHRVPGIVSYPPAIVTDHSEANENVSFVSWETVTTMDFLPTIMDVLGIDRPANQQSWAMDGRSILPLLRNASNFRWSDTTEGPRSLGLGYHDSKLDIARGYGYRYDKWKYVEGSASCTDSSCQKPMLFDLSSDLGERHDLSEVYPEILQDLQQKFREWHSSVLKSRREESKCHKTQLALPKSLLVQDVLDN